MKGWSTSEVAMSGELLTSTEDHLGSLFVGDPDAAMDDVLNHFSAYNCES